MSTLAACSDSEEQKEDVMERAALCGLVSLPSCIFLSVPIRAGFGIFVGDFLGEVNVLAFFIWVGLVF